MGVFFSKTKSAGFIPDRDIPSLTGKVILVTGGTHHIYGTGFQNFGSIAHQLLLKRKQRAGKRNRSTAG
jgi:hypothetical protein